MLKWRYWDKPNERFTYFVVYIDNDGMIREDMLFGSDKDDAIARASIKEEQLVEVYGLTPLQHAG